MPATHDSDSGDLTRRDFVRLAGAAGAALGLQSCVGKPLERPDAAVGRESAAGKPNIIFIMVDDLGYADLGCYGQKEIRTPCIDAMAAGGTRFTQCYSGSPVCAPARSVLMTGQHTGHTTVRGNFGKGGVRGLGGGDGRVPLGAEDVTVAEVLKRAGYATGITGKWGLGEPNTTGEPNRKGFDEWFGFLNQRRAHDYYVDYLWHNREKVDVKGKYVHDLFTDFGLDFIRKHRAGPFFLYMAYTIPHAKYEVPDIAPYADAPWSKDEKAYAAMVTRMDRDVGRIAALLTELGIDRNTIVFFCSDNGAAKLWEPFASSGPLRGRKRDVYEGGIRVPMVVRWPDVVPAGLTSEAPWYFADVFPTCAGLAGAPASQGVDGVSVVPALRGMDQPQLSERFMYWEFFGKGFNQAARWRDWKAIRMRPRRPLELYDLSRDVGEKDDVAGRHPEIVSRFEEYLATCRTESPAWPVEGR